MHVSQPLLCFPVLSPSCGKKKKKKENYSRLGQGNVNGSRVEDGPASDEANLQDEADKVKGVVVQHDATGIPSNLNEAAKVHADGEPVTAPSEAQVDVNEGSDGIESEEKRVDDNGGSVMVDAVRERAQSEGAVGFRAKGNEVLGVIRHAERKSRPSQ